MKIEVVYKCGCKKTELCLNSVRAKKSLLLETSLVKCRICADKDNYEVRNG